ncbi:TPA: hypothetical protein ACRGOW_005688 [Klebsiella pneumoniae]
MTAPYTIDEVAKHMMASKWTFPHSDDNEANFKALYTEVSKAFPGLTPHDFTAAFNRMLDVMRAANDRPAS